jgi:hypothetical protein
MEWKMGGIFQFLPKSAGLVFQEADLGAPSSLEIECLSQKLGSQ